MEKLQQLYEGKAKKIFATNDPELLITRIKDDATAFNAKKKGQIDEKGRFNTLISEILFKMLEAKGIPTHYVKTLDDRNMLVRKVTILPIEVVVRNIVAGSLAKTMGMPEGTAIKQPILDFYYKEDALDDPYINESRILAFGYATKAELDALSKMAMEINDLLKAFFLERKIKLVDFKLEFGKTSDGKVILADEISPDTCRFWDAETNEKLDKDRFRRDLGNVKEAYAEIFSRVSK